MNEKESHDFEELSQGGYDEYKILETRLYGELIRSCQRYNTKLRLISILGILDYVKQEILDLEKENMKFKDDKNPEKQTNIAFDK